MVNFNFMGGHGLFTELRKLRADNSPEPRGQPQDSKAHGSGHQTQIRPVSYFIALALEKHPGVL